MFLNISAYNHFINEKLYTPVFNDASSIGTLSTSNSEDYIQFQLERKNTNW